jgi:hypothetical protein
MSTVSSIPQDLQPILIEAKHGISGEYFQPSDWQKLNLYPLPDPEQELAGCPGSYALKLSYFWEP